MRCSTCSAENTSEARFCATCGVPLEPAFERDQAVNYCPTCGAQNTAAALFCGECGSELKALPGGGPLPGGRDAVQVVVGGARGSFAPRDLGSLIDETFRLYRGNFWFFFSIALVAQIPSALAQIIPNEVVSILFLITALIVYVIVGGAMIAGVAQLYVGRGMRASDCLTMAVGRFWSLLAGLLLFIIALAVSGLLSFVIIGIPLFFYLLVGWFFYPQAVMIESKRSPKESLGRSRELVKGSWWRVFGIGVVYFILLFVMAMVFSIPGFIAGAFSQIAAALLLAVSSAAIQPLSYIGSTLVYIDLRARKEGYSVEKLASETGF